MCRTCKRVHFYCRRVEGDVYIGTWTRVFRIIADSF